MYLSRQALHMLVLQRVCWTGFVVTCWQMPQRKSSRGSEEFIFTLLLMPNLGFSVSDAGKGDLQLYPYDICRF